MYCCIFLFFVSMCVCVLACVLLACFGKQSVAISKAMGVQKSVGLVVAAAACFLFTQDFIYLVG